MKDDEELLLEAVSVSVRGKKYLLMETHTCIDVNVFVGKCMDVNVQNA